MKKIFIFAVALLMGANAFCQKDSTKEEEPVYLRFPFIPQFTIYKAPDSTAFSRSQLHANENTIFMIFSPDCEHCQHETEMLTKNIDQFKNTQIIMVTYLPYDEMIKFYHVFKIANYPQITMGRDTRFFFPPFFHVRNLPSIFVYDKDGKFKKSFEGDVKPESILAEL